MRPTSFWPFATYVTCVRCRQPVESANAVVVTCSDRFGNDELDGLAHAECPE